MAAFKQAQSCTGKPSLIFSEEISWTSSIRLTLDMHKESHTGGHHKFLVVMMIGESWTF